MIKYFYPAKWKNQKSVSDFMGEKTLHLLSLKKNSVFCNNVLSVFVGGGEVCVKIFIWHNDGMWWGILYPFKISYLAC